MLSDTIRDSDSPSIIRRFADMLHHSFRSTRFGSRRNSDDTSSHSSVHLSRKTSLPPSGASPTHTLLRRATSKTAKGSSLIRKDGSIILTKNGKIISVRPDRTAVHRDRSFQGFADINSRKENGISKSLSEINVLKRGGVELAPLLARANPSTRSSRSLSNHSRPSSAHSSSSKLYHTSLTKIDSVDESENCIDCRDNKLKLPNAQGNSSTAKPNSLTKLSEGATRNSSSSSYHGLTCPEIEHPDDECMPSSPVVITIESDNSEPNFIIPNFIVRDKSNKITGKLKSSKSENMLQKVEASSVNENKSKTNICKSSDDVFTVPVLRYPSVERLDVKVVTRSSSDASITRQIAPGSPLYKRRWLSNKSIQGDQVKRK